MRWAAASRTGTSHKRDGSLKQDVFKVSELGNGRGLFVVSDGAGSAAYGGQSAALICRFWSNVIRSWCEVNQSLPDDVQIIQWIDDLRDWLFAIAEDRETTPRQFAATLALLLVFPEEVMAVQIGDSSIVGRRGGVWEAICWPENGEYASTTFFVTDDPEVRMNIRRLEDDFDAFAIFSDGIEAIALDRTAGVPYRPFWEPMIKPVDSAEAQGLLRGLSQALGVYLDSPRVCERTDDDKTLILISRA